MSFIIALNFLKAAIQQNYKTQFIILRFLFSCKNFGCVRSFNKMFSQLDLNQKEVNLENIMKCNTTTERNMATSDLVN